MASTSNATAIDLEQTRRRIMQWRETRTHRGAPMPAALWGAAIAVARQHGLYPTARALHLDYGSLKKRRDAADAGRAGAPTFVELPAAQRPELGSCVIALDTPHGGRMRIEVTGVTVADLVTLTQAAWGRGR
jgi:hypothetical protein